MPRTIITPPHGKETVPDVPNFSWADYGMRAGLPRILEAFAAREPAGLDQLQRRRHRRLSAGREAMREAGWEFIGHGMHQKAMNHVEGGEEALDQGLPRQDRRLHRHRDARLAVAGPARDAGHAGPPARHSASIMSATGWSTTCRPGCARTHGPLIAMPYNLEINDSIIYAIERHATGEMCEARSSTRSSASSASASDSAMVLALGLHPHLISVPHRIHELEDMLDMLTGVLRRRFLHRQRTGRLVRGSGSRPKGNLTWT